MGHTFKRLLSLVVALFLVISLIPMGALPAKAASAIEMNYDDRLSISELGGNSASSVAITAQSVTSKQVGSTNADSAVLTYNGGTLIATGTGTATVTVDGTAYTVTVKAAPISLVMITGHSIGAGQTGNAAQSVVCPDGQVYTTYGTALAGAATAGVGLGYASASRPAGIDASTAAGDGTIGEGSALAYKWNQLTGEKIWVLNTAVGGTALTKWVKGGACYTNAVAVYKYAQAVLAAEQAAGHYVLKDEAIIYHSAANWNYSDNGNWNDADGEGWYKSMVEGYKADLGVETIGLVPIWTDSSKNSYSADTPANFWMGANKEYPGLFVASVATRTWLRDVSTFPAITYTTQGTAVSVPTDIWGILNDSDKVHLDQVAYNAAGLDIAQNLYNVLRTQQTAASVVLRDGSHNQIGASITMAVGDSIKLVPEVAPVSVNDLTFTLSANLSLSYPGIITGNSDGMGKVTISQGDKILKEVKVAVGDATEEVPTYPADWTVEYHCVCGNPISTGNPCAKAGHQMVEWKPWTETRTVPFRDGYWYLTQDLDFTNASQFPYGTDFSTSTAVIGRDASSGASALLGKQVNVYVDLNGKTVIGKSGHRIYRLENDFGHTLTITDTAGGGKLIPKNSTTNSNAGMGIWTRNTGSRVTIYGGTIDGSGAVLTSDSGTVIHNCATMEIYGGTIIGGKVSSAAGDAHGGNIYNSGTLNIFGGVIQGGTSSAPTTDKYARGANIFNAGTVNIYGGTVTGGTADGSRAQGANIFNDNGKTLNIYGGTVIGGTAKSAGKEAQGAVIRNQGKMNVYGGTIKGGSATGSNIQGVTVSNVGTFYMESGTIESGTGNTTGSAGGGAFFSTNGGTIKGGTIIGGKLTKNGTVASGCFGGAIYVWGGTLTMDGGTVKAASYTENVAYQGAAVYVNTGATFVMNDGVVAAGKVNDYGGAVAVPGGGTFTLNGGVVTGSFYSNGAPVTDPADAHASGVTKVLNSAGAAVGAWGGKVNMTGGTIIGGKASNVGGSVSVRYGGVFNMSGGLITGGADTATTDTSKGGGNVAVHYDNGHRPTFNMTGGTITDGRGTNPGVLVNLGGQINISGNAVIKGNVDKNGAERNLILMDNDGSGASYGLKVGVGTMGSNAHVGITMATAGVFTNAVSAANGAAFFGDAGHYVEQNADGALTLVNGHKGHCVCGGTTDRCDHTALEGEWKPWDGKSSISESGNYYLTQTVTGSTQYWMGGSHQNTTKMTINLCLNGHSITSNYRVFGIAKGVTFNLMNCNHAQSQLIGKQTGAQSGAIFMHASTAELPASFSMYGNIKVIGQSATAPTTGGAMNVLGTFNMYGGEIVGQTVSDTGGAIYVSGTFNMYDGKISGGIANGGNGGGNVYVASGAFTMYDGEIVGGVATAGHGGNLKIMQDAVVEIKGGVIRDGKIIIAENATNKDLNGGNIAMVDQDNDDLGGLTIGGTAVIKNGEANRGGNIFVHTGSLTIKDSAKIEGGVAYGYSGIAEPSVEVNWSRGEATASNRTYVAVSGTPIINSIHYKDYLDTTGLQAGADIGMNRETTGKVSSGVLAANVASGIYSTNSDLVMIPEEDGLYAKSAADYHYHDLCNREGYAICNHENLIFQPITDVTEIKAPGNYYLTGDIVDAAEVNITGSGVINLCMNGYSWSGVARTAVVQNNITLNITNCSDTQSVISGRGNSGTSNTDTVRGGVFCVWSKSTLNVIGNIKLLRTDSKYTNLQGGVISAWGSIGLYGVTVDGNAKTGANAMTGGLLRLESGYASVITIVDSVLENGWCSNGGAIMTNGGAQVVNISNSTIRNMKATYTGGGAIYSSSSTINITGGTTFDNCVATSDKKGGAIYNGGGKVTFSGENTIKNCTAQYGGALHNESGTMTLNSGLVIENCSGQWGTIYVKAGTVDINSGVIIRNCNPDEGGAVYMESGICNMNGARFENCSAGNGAAVYMWGGTFNMNSGSVITGCHGKDGVTYANGGAFNLEKSCTVNIKDGALIENCSVNNGGGAFLIKAGTVNFAGTVKNTSAKYGGAGYMSGGTFNMEGGLITDCSASGSGGGGFMVDNASTVFNLKGGTIQNCKTTKAVANDVYGGGCFMIYKSTLNISGGKVLNGSATFGGNISLTNGGKLKMTGGLVEGGQSHGSHGGNISIRYDCTAEITGGTVKNGVANPAAGADPNNKDAMDKCGGNIAVVHNNASTALATLKLGGTAQLIGGTGDRAGNIFVHSGKLEISGSASVTGGTALNKGYGGGNPCIHVNFVEDNGINSCFVTISGKPTIENIRVAAAMDLSGLETGAKIGITVDSARKISKAPMSAELAACFTSTNANLKLVNQEDGLYLRDLSYHVYDEGVQIVEPSCTVDGETLYTCKYCGETYTDITPAPGHNPVTDEAVKATCTQTGLTEGSHCDVCGEVIVAQQVVPKTELTYVPAQEATCHQRGHAEYWYCAECDIYFADAAATMQTNIKNLSTPALVGLTHVEAVEASCHQEGMNEYWYCAECDAVFADAAGMQLTNRKNLTIPALVGLTHVEALEVGCHQNGRSEYWYCAECEAVFADAAGTQLTNIKNLTIAAPALLYAAAVEASCHQAGHAEYWYCGTCDAVFADAAGIMLTNIKNLSTPALVGLTHVEAVEPTCHQNGHSEYWYCTECEAVFADAAGMRLTNLKNLTIEAAPLTYVPALEASCHQAGHAEYWYCMECEAIFTDAAGIHLTNIKNLSTPALLGLTYAPAVEATCHQTGHAEYWYCAECEAVFADAAGTMLTNIKNLSTPALVGLTHVEAVEASCHQEGMNEYWYCAECDAVFADAAGMMLTNRKNLTIPATVGLTYVAPKDPTYYENGHYEYWYCAECEAVFTDAAGIHLTNFKNLTIPMLTAYAQIGDIRYGTLAEALEAAADNDVIQLLLSTTVDGTETWDLGNVTLDMGENTITVNGNLTILSGSYIGKLEAETGVIAISGGLFSAKVPDAYCAEGYIATVVPNENGMYTVEALGDTVAQNQVTGQVYNTVAEALMAAEGTSETIKLVADSQEYMVVVPAGVALDLNGKTLTASYMSAFGPISDNIGGGLLKIAQGKATLFAQEQLSVWNGEGYIFIGNIALSADTNVKIEQTEKGLEFSFLPVLNAEMRALLADGGNDNGVKLAVRLTWDRANPDVENKPYDVVFSDAFVQKVYSSATAEWCFVLTVKNAANLSNLTFNIVLISDTGAELVSQTIG